MSKIKKASLKILFVVMLLVITLCFSACASVRSATISNDDGTIDEIVNIKLDKQKIVLAGQNYTEIQEKIKYDCNRVGGLILASFLQRTEEEDMQVYNEKLDVLISDNWVDDCFEIRIKFDSRDVYNFYYKIRQEDEIKPEVEHHFFYDKITYTGFTSYAVSNSLVGNLKAYFEMYYDPEFLDLSNCKFCYSMVTNLRRERSDADYVNKINGKYYHTWEIDIDQPNQQIEIYYNLANRGNCIIFCVILALSLCAILLIVGLIVSKINKNKPKQVAETDDSNNTASENNNLKN